MNGTCFGLFGFPGIAPIHWTIESLSSHCTFLRSFYHLARHQHRHIPRLGVELGSCQVLWGSKYMDYAHLLWGLRYIDMIHFGLFGAPGVA